jgi:hypothetical protein
MGFFESRQRAKSGGIAGIGLARAKRKEAERETRATETTRQAKEQESRLGKGNKPSYVKAMRERTAIEKETLAFKKEQAKRISGKRIPSSKYGDESKETRVKRITINRL